MQIARRIAVVVAEAEGPALPPVPLFRCFGKFSFSHAPVSRLGPPSSGFESETLPCKKNNLEKQKVYRTTEQGNGVGLFDFFVSGHRTRGWWVGRGRVPAAVAAPAVAAAPARPPALLLAPDEAVTARELLAV